MRKELSPSWQTCLLIFCSFLTSYQVHADCDVMAADLSFEEDALYDGYLLGGNGCLYDPVQFTIDDVPPMLPENATTDAKASVFINGSAVIAMVHLNEMQDIANGSGLPVVGIRNSARNGIKEITKLLHRSATTKTLLKNIMKRITLGERIRIVSASQGTFFTSRALLKAQYRIRLRHLFNRSKRKVEAALVEVVTVGAAAPFWPNGPQYVHYINAEDGIPKLLGPKSPIARPGSQAIFATFSHMDTEPFDGCPHDETEGESAEEEKNDFMNILKSLKILVPEAHFTCVYSDFIQDFDTLRSFAPSSGNIDVPISMQPINLQ